ncbi:MAG: AAA family ATPase [Alkalinema sp. RU_4_3]|nr:AAA family ATPase [Alkalinema sp. RU_4_3]
MDLFDHRAQTDQPLAARMRPRTLEEFIGQGSIVGPGRLLRRAIQADQLSSLIFYGPPGTGKTTLAQIIANTTLAHFIALNAVLSGIKDIREAIEIAQEKRRLYNRRSILFVDEVHRFNKTQQDALLPWVENGTVILIGATTENPYFEVNKALVSRSRLFQLKPLTPADLEQILHQALTDPDRGYGQQTIKLEPDAQAHLVNIANGDARSLLNALELAVLTSQNDETQDCTITLAIAEESIQHRAVLYDKEGDAHFDTISAFIKSLRGSDPDAALYWLARMVYAGEDPRFIFRRMLIFAGEDVGMADPNAVVVANACAQAFDRVGLPEGRYPLAQAALYLATCPKSNSVMAFFDALSAIEQERESEVPLHLRDASRDKEGFGHGSGYLYPHAYRDHWVAQQYLPKSLQGQIFYQPSNQGYEAQIQLQVIRQRETQLAALLEGIGTELPEGLTVGPEAKQLDRWMQRTLSQTSARLSELRDRLFHLAQIQRHEIILDLQASSGLLTWEALRRAPEGGTYALVTNPKDYQALTEQAVSLPELQRPILLKAGSKPIPWPDGILFDCAIGRNFLASKGDVSISAKLQPILDRLSPTGRLVLAEPLPNQAMRLYSLLDPTWISSKLLKKITKAEEAIYRGNPEDITHLPTHLETLGFQVTTQTETTTSDLLISPSLCDRWFAKTAPSYRHHLSAALTEPELTQLETCFRDRLTNQTVPWTTHHLYLLAQK